jgi:hypothetical protein
MSANEIFKSTVQTNGHLAGVFEFDGEIGYFYLYEANEYSNEKVVAAIQVINGIPDFGEEDVTILWNVAQRMVGLFIKHQLWAAFDGMTREKFGGNYLGNNKSSIPPDVAKAFEPLLPLASH